MEEIDEPSPARLAFEGRAVELLDLLPTFRAYVQMSLPYAVFGVHGIAPVITVTGIRPTVGILGQVDQRICRPVIRINGSYVSGDGAAGLTGEIVQTHIRGLHRTLSCLTAWGSSLVQIDVNLEDELAVLGLDFQCK